MLITQYSNFNKNLRYIVVKLKKNNYQDLPWNNTIEEDTFRYPDLLAGGKGINVWPIVKNSTPTPCSWPF
jgi:disulfide oxidoreductase YuzD